MTRPTLCALPDAELSLAPSQPEGPLKGPLWPDFEEEGDSQTERQQVMDSSPFVVISRLEPPMASDIESSRH